jgi:hypothetical protein
MKKTGIGDASAGLSGTISWEETTKTVAMEPPTER